MRAAMLAVLVAGCASSTCREAPDAPIDTPPDSPDVGPPSRCTVNEGHVYVGFGCGADWDFVVYDDDRRVVRGLVDPPCARGSRYVDLGTFPSGHYLLAMESDFAGIRAGRELLEPERCRDVGSGATTSPDCAPIELDVRPCGLTVVVTQ